MEIKNQPAGQRIFTRLEAKIREEDGAFTVSVRLQNHRKKSDVAWGQEIAPTIEMASFMIGALAEQFSISQKPYQFTSTWKLSRMALSIELRDDRVNGTAPKRPSSLRPFGPDFP
jgi:hypothetical protein